MIAFGPDGRRVAALAAALPGAQAAAGHALVGGWRQDVGFELPGRVEQRVVRVTLRACGGELDAPLPAVPARDADGAFAVPCGDPPRDTAAQAALLAVAPPIVELAGAPSPEAFRAALTACLRRLMAALKAGTLTETPAGPMLAAGSGAIDAATLAEATATEACELLVTAATSRPHAALPPAVRELLAVHELDVCVQSSGFASLFADLGREQLLAARALLGRAGLATHGALLDDAIALGDAAGLWQARTITDATVRATLDDLTDRYVTAPDANVLPAVGRYVRAHADGFALPATSEA